jgi:hypothetical protein
MSYVPVGQAARAVAAVHGGFVPPELAHVVSLTGQADFARSRCALRIALLFTRMPDAD